MSKFRGIERLKITKLFQESRYLDNDPEYIFSWGVVVDLEALDSLVVLQHGIESVLLQLLPVTT